MWVGGQSDLFSEKRFLSRVQVISFLFAVGYGIITLRLFQLQVIKGADLEQLSESNRTQVIFLRSPRGDLIDRNGEAFVTNRPSWSLIYSPPDQLKGEQGKIRERLKPFLKSFPKYWERRLQTALKTKRMVRLVEDVPNNIAFALQEMGELVPGLRVVMEFRRGYPKGFLAGHLAGYLAEIDEKELGEDEWRTRKLGDLIGKMGLERELDEELRGKDGGVLIEVDSKGRLSRVIKEIPSQKGMPVQLTIDLKLQKLAEDELAKTSSGKGAVVMINVNTGEILVWASAPTYDPDSSMAEALVNPANPFLDRVYKGVYAPGSTFKVVTALTGLENNLINLGDRVLCKGYEILQDKRGGERKYRCWKVHGEVNFWRAVTESCDVYFYLLGAKVGPDALSQMAVDCGFGDTVLKLLPGERAGVVPSPAWKRKKGLGGWSTGDTYNMAIGQGYLSCTPLQMTSFMAGVSTKGQFWKPFVIKKILDANGAESYSGKPELRRTLALKDSTWTTMDKALKMVVERGTGYGAFVPYLDIGGKTGTAQNPHGVDHAWFTAYAGYKNENPAVAVCVMVENGGGGGSISAPIAARLIKLALPEKTSQAENSNGN